MKVFIGPYPEGDEVRKVEIEIHKYDSWNADHTLALIALPLLKQLKEQTQGAPYVDDEDVPEELKSTSAPPKENDYDIDDLHFARWDYVLDCILWSLEQHVNYDPEEDKFFKFNEAAEPESGLEKLLGKGKCEIDKEGLEAYHARKQKGFVLFGITLKSNSSFAKSPNCPTIFSTHPFVSYPSAPSIRGDDIQVLICWIK